MHVSTVLDELLQTKDYPWDIPITAADQQVPNLQFLSDTYHNIALICMKCPMAWIRVSQPGFREMSLGVPREILIEKNKHPFLNLLDKINRSTEKYHSLLKTALTIIIGLLYLQLTDHANVPWPVDIIIFMQGFPETWKLFQGFLQGKKIEKNCYNPIIIKIIILHCGSIVLSHT
jgi:hypothetical protein